MAVIIVIFDVNVSDHMGQILEWAILESDYIVLSLDESNILNPNKSSMNQAITQPLMRNLKHNGCLN